MIPTDPTIRPALRCAGVVRAYGGQGSRVPALRGVSFRVAPGTFVALTGPSGSGKSTLLRLLACVDRPDEGTIELGGTDVTGLSRRRRVELRRARLGLLQQVPADNLLGYLTVREHLELAAAMRGLRPADPQVDALLDQLGLVGRAGHHPQELSGGEQQRTAIAFAAVGPPDVLIADEPTGQLDHASLDAVVDAFGILTSRGVAVVAATHDPALAARADEVLHLRDGRIAGGRS